MKVEIENGATCVDRSCPPLPPADCLISNITDLGSDGQTVGPDFFRELRGDPCGIVPLGLCVLASETDSLNSMPQPAQPAAVFQMKIML